MLRATGFRFVETVRGVNELREEQWKLGPLLGYEADTPLRSRVLSAWNRANRRAAVVHGTVRIGIHPHDLELPLGEELRHDLAQCQSITLQEVFAAPSVLALG